MLKIIKLSAYDGFSELERELDRVGLKHGIEPRAPFMPEPWWIDDEEDDEDA